jgi:hypothetical protein
MTILKNGISRVFLNEGNALSLFNSSFHFLLPHPASTSCLLLLARFLLPIPTPTSIFETKFLYHISDSHFSILPLPSYPLSLPNSFFLYFYFQLRTSLSHFPCLTPLFHFPFLTSTSNFGFLTQFPLFLSIPLPLFRGDTHTQVPTAPGLNRLTHFATTFEYPEWES